MLDDLIQFGILIVTVVAVLYSQYSDRKQRRLAIFAEYTRRYQEIILQMPDEVYSGASTDDVHIMKYMSIYFDLCSEEFHLWESGAVPAYIWNLWKEGMRLTMKKDIYRKSWAALKPEYYSKFVSFFDQEVLD